MGLYLCLFDYDNDEEVDGLEVGSYSDFNILRDYVTRELEGRIAGSKFPTLILHSDCDGEWSASDCMRLLVELAQIGSFMKTRPVVPFASEWQAKLAKSLGLDPQNAFDSFIDVDGEPLLERLAGLAEQSIKLGLPILFQ